MVYSLHGIVLGLQLPEDLSLKTKVDIKHEILEDDEHLDYEVVQEDDGKPSYIGPLWTKTNLLMYEQTVN